MGRGGGEATPRRSVMAHRKKTDTERFQFIILYNNFTKAAQGPVSDRPDNKTKSLQHRELNV